MNGKIDKETVARLKTELGLDVLYSWPTPDQKHDFVFKPISHDLHRRIRKMQGDAEERQTRISKMELDSMVFDECIVWPLMMPEQIDALPVGYVGSVSKVIQEKSGFTEVDINGNVLGPALTVIPLIEPEYWPIYTQEELNEIKESTPFRITHVRVDGWVFLLRPLCRADMLVAQTAHDNTLALAQCVTLWPKEIKWEAIPAGYIDHLGNIALSMSGYNTQDIEVVEL